MLIGMRVAQIQKLLYTLNESKRTKARACLNPLNSSFLVSLEQRFMRNRDCGITCAFALSRAASCTCSMDGNEDVAPVIWWNQQLRVEDHAPDIWLEHLT